MGQRNPLDRPLTAAMGKATRACPAADPSPEPGRRMKDDVALAEHDASVIRGRATSE
jgi:hypothetical protein